VVSWYLLCISTFNVSNDMVRIFKGCNGIMTEHLFLWDMLKWGLVFTLVLLVLSEINDKFDQF
jgi:hypothetical protein